jgi:predicted permease
MSELRDDVRLAVRTLASQKGLTTAALLSLALGIGANTALFSVAYGVLLRPLPYADAERLVRLSEQHPGANAPVRTLLSNLTFHAWRDAARTLDSLAAYSGSSPLDTSGGEAVRIPGAAVSPALFSLLGARPAVGRLLLPHDADPGAAAVVVLSDGFWRERFGGDTSAIGRSLTLDGQPHTIVGVAAPDFYFPSRAARLWTPFSVPGGSADPARQSIAVVSAIGRLRPDSTPAQAAAEGTAAARSVPRPPLAETIFGEGGPVEVRADVLLDGITERVRPALLVLSGAVAFVLLICCANVANLLLSRGVARQRELAVRAALGASGGRLVRQLLTESLVLSTAGGVLGLALAWALLALFPALAPAHFPRLEDVRADGRVIAFAVLASIAAGVLSGLWPALRSARADLLPALRDGAGASGSARTLRLGGGLLVAEAALAVVLLVGGLLLLRSFFNLVTVDPGYDANGVLQARVFLPGASRQPERARAFVDALLDRLRATPGVVAAGAGRVNWVSAVMPTIGAMLPASGPGGESVTARAVTYAVTPGYAEALSHRLRRGRLLQAGDRSIGSAGMLVNEEFVRVYLSDGLPVVGRLYQNLYGDGVTHEIVGVVANVLKNGLDARPQSEIYLLPRRGLGLAGELSVVVRTSGDARGLAPTLRSAVLELEPMAALDVAPLAQQVSASLSQPRFAATLLAALALVAVTLAATGLYGVLSHNVSRRRREMGVRAALGASRRDLFALILRQGLAFTGLGLAVGMAGAAVLTRALEALLFGVTPLDAVAFAAAPAVLLAVALVACLVPARRATAFSPSEALRSE